MSMRIKFQGWKINMGKNSRLGLFDNKKINFFSSLGVPRCLGDSFLSSWRSWSRRAGSGYLFNRRRAMDLTLATAIVMVLLLAPRGLAVQTSRWVHNTEADFSQGQNKNTVVTNMGDVKLAAAHKVIGEIPEQASIIYNLQNTPDGDLYLAAGPEARLLRRHGDNVKEVLSLPGEQIFSLALDAKGQLLVGISGGQSRIARLEGDKLHTLVQLDGVRYIWDMAVDGPRIFVATGTDGRVLLVNLDHLAQDAGQAANDDGQGDDDDGDEVAAPPQSAPATAGDNKASKSEQAKKHKTGNKKAHEKSGALPKGVTELLRTDESNVLCLARDKQGRIYAGTDTDGLIYRLTLKDNGSLKDSFVLYNANEPEIGSLVVTDDGTVYAGTADADQARPGRLNEAVSSEIGRMPKPVTEPEKSKGPGQVPHTPPPAPISQAPDDGKALPATQPNGPESKDMGEDSPDNEAASNQSHLTAKAMSDRGQTANASTDSATSMAAGGANDPIRLAILQQLSKNAHPQAPRLPIPPQRRPHGHPGGPPPGAHPGGPGGPPGGPNKEGNAIYRIASDGSVTEIFRESVMILKLLEDDGKLTVATGNDGLIYRVDLDAGRNHHPG